MSRIRRLPLVIAAALLAATAPEAAHAQDGATVSGRVTAPGGVPLQAASVFIEDLNIGSLTREDGRYTFLVPAARAQGQSVTLTARLVGYRAQSVQIALQPGLIERDFQLESTPLRLGEVVVTGAGTVTPVERLGTVRNTVSSELVDRSNEHNLVQALAAKAPNVEVTQQSGEPGASSYIRIRGLTTIQGTGQPLFVVDGVPIDNTTQATGLFLESTVAPNRAMDINPHDIESIEILKGAAAAAIYGARAAQGVVLITTRRGRPGITRYSLRSQFTQDRVNQSVPLQRSFGQGIFGDPIPGFSLSWGPELDTGTPTYDHWGELFRTGSTMDHTITASGGSERTTFYISAGRMDQRGVIVGPNNSYERSSARMNASHQFRDDLVIGANVSFVDARGAFIQKGSNLSGLLLGGLRTPPDFNNLPYLTEEGLHRSYRLPDPTDYTTSRGYDNPFWTAFHQNSLSNVGRVYGNVNVEFNPLEWLGLRYTLGADYSNDERVEALPPSSSNFPQGIVNRVDFINYAIDHNLLLTGTWALTPDVETELTLGHNLNSRRYRQHYVTGRTWISPEGPATLNNTVSLDPLDFQSLVHTESYFGQAQLALRERLFLTGSLRNDGFSTFGESQRRHWYPKLSAAYTFTAPQQLGFVSEGKLRAAWGEAGREPGVYQTITGYELGNIFDSGWGPFLRPAQGGYGGLISSPILGQEDLRPERTREVEAGFDLGLFAGMADFSATYYNALSRDVIFLLPLASSSGRAFQARNAATIRNSGVELSFNFRPINTANFSWDVGLNWATNDNLVREMRGVERVDMPGSFFGVTGTAWEGYPVGVIRGNDFARCRYGEDNVIRGIDINTACSADGAPNGALYIAEDGFPITDPTNRVIMDPNPDWTGSIRTNVRFLRNLQLSGLMDIRQGGQIWNGTRGALIYFGTHADTRVRGEERTFGSDYFRGPVAGPGAGESVLLDEDWFLFGLGSGFGPVASHFIEDASFIKLRELSLAYTMDNAFVRSTLGLSSLDLRIAGRNLRTWTSYTGIDPETNLAGAEVALRGIDYFNNPQTRSFVFTIGLNR